MNITFVTSNSDKVREAEKILDTSLKRENLDLKEIQSLSIEEVVRDKAKRAFEELGEPVIVDDTGLFIQEWDGFPGPFSRWFNKAVGIERLCKMIEKNREAEAITAVGFCRKGEVEVFKGAVEGEISWKPRGDSGFGWDPIFVPEGYDKTFAELCSDVKNKISMRRKAFLKFKRWRSNKKNSLHKKTKDSM